jgi:hypothetical protein
VSTCDVCWDTHGCDLPAGHGGPEHFCLAVDQPCSEIYWDSKENQWIRWDQGEKVGPVRAFHALAEDPFSPEADVGTPYGAPFEGEVPF